MRQRLVLLLSISISVLIAFLFTFPRYTDEDDNQLLQQYSAIKRDLLSVMTFNIRFDGIERDPNNHFTRRISRLTETIEKWQPAILAVQEPFTSQMLHWQSHLPSYYRSIGYRRHGQDSSSSLSQQDFQTGVLYDSRVLKLVEHDYLWLSKTPRTVGSKDWNSGGARTLNIARFELTNSTSSADVLVFNTHLDVRSEEARREQSKLIRSTIHKWQNQYPSAATFLFGDFNAAPGQSTYHILTSLDFLQDTWTVCKSHPSTCVSNSFSSTFHGWLGAMINTYGFQLLQTLVFTFHGLGIQMPYEIPAQYTAYVRIAKELSGFCRALNWSEMVALWSSHRFHVDWILYQNSIDGNNYAQPRFVSVVDVRSRNYSSDHFPIVALFQLKDGAKG